MSENKGELHKRLIPTFDAYALEFSSDDGETDFDIVSDRMLTEILNEAKNEWLEIENNLRKRTYRRRAEAVATAIITMHEEKDKWFLKWFGKT